MARTTSKPITSKIIRAGQLRLRILKHDPKFQKDLSRLEKIARGLPVVPLIPASELTSRNCRLPARAERKFDRWREAAEEFLRRWGFKPYLGEDNGVQLFVQSPASYELNFREHSVKWHLDEKDFAPGDVRAVRDYYASFLKKRRHIVERRVNLKTMEERAIALELKAQGKNLKTIAKILNPTSYKKLTDRTTDIKKLPLGELREQFSSLVKKYIKPGVSWASAEKKAAAELGLTINSKAAATKPLTERVRHLIKSRQK